MIAARSDHHAFHASLTKRAAVASVAVASFLLVLKALAAWRTGSVTMLGSLADTAVDVVASLIILYGVGVAAAPADREHGFGHGKAEAIAALAQVELIGLSAAAVAWRAAQRLISGDAPAEAEFGIAVSLIAIAVTFGLLLFQRRVITGTGSLAIRTDHIHYQSDLLLNLSVIGALALDQYVGLAGTDAVVGVAIAIWLVRSAWHASHRAVDELMDREWPEEERQRLLAIANRHPDVRGIHDLRTRSSGSRDFVQFHVWVEPQMTVQRAHVVMDEVELDLRPAFPGAQFLIHVDPEGHVDPPQQIVVSEGQKA